ncbi:MAG: ATP synthase subunit I [Lysobacterales bacterium]
MEATAYTRAASSAYRASLKTLALLVVLSVAIYGWIQPAAGWATLAGGLIAWLPHLLMVSKVFGVTRRGVKPVTLTGLMLAEAMKLVFTGILFGLAFYWMPADLSRIGTLWLFAGFILTLASNLVGLGLMVSKMDSDWNAEQALLRERDEQDASRNDRHLI